MKTMGNSDGFVLVVTLLVLVVLSIIGIAATKTSFLENTIAENDRVQRKSLYQAEAGVTLGSNIIEENINCPVGFDSTGNISDPYTSNSLAVADLEGAIRVYPRSTKGLAIYYKDYPVLDANCVVTSGDPDIDYPIANIGTGTQETSIWAGGGSKMLPGGSLQMAAGYEGKGKGAAGGGTQRDYEIVARHQGLNNAESTVILGWRHIIGSETYDCRYEL